MIAPEVLPKDESWMPEHVIERQLRTPARLQRPSGGNTITVAKEIKVGLEKAPRSEAASTDLKEELIMVYLVRTDKGYDKGTFVFWRREY